MADSLGRNVPVVELCSTRAKWSQRAISVTVRQSLTGDDKGRTCELRAGFSCPMAGSLF